MSNALLEQGYLGAPQTKFLMENKWKSRLSALESVNGKLNLEKKAATAVCLENTQKIVKFLESTGATQSSDVGAYKRFALDIVGAVVPNLIAFDLVSVQAISNRVGMVNYIKYSYGTSKGSTQDGTTFGDVLNYGQSDVNYTSEDVVGEELATSASVTYSGTLEWDRVTRESLKIVVGSVVIVDDGDGALTAASGLDSSGTNTINYITGEYSFKLSSLNASAVPVATYKYNNEYVPQDQIPSVTLSIESLPVKSKTRKLATLFGIEANFELQKEYGESADDLLSATSSAEIAHEIDIEICNDLYALAANSPDLRWSTVVPVGVSKQDHYDSFKIKLDEASNKIYKATRKVRPNWVLCGANVLTVIESIRTFTPSGVSDYKGPYMAGTLGKYKVFVSPDMDDNAYVLGYKGTSFLDTGYIYAPYMPLVASAAVMLEDMMSRKGFATMYATRAVNSKMYIRGTITQQ